MNYILGIDQSTQGTKAILFDENGVIVGRAEKAHRQIVNDCGWVSHDLNEIYGNVLTVVRAVVEESGIDKNHVRAVGLSNQRETSCAWNRVTGEPIAEAVVWQCSRAEEICREVRELGKADFIRQRTGLQLSPYFPASKYAWLIRNTEGAAELQDRGDLRLGTVDSFLIFKLSGGKCFKTDYSNASRTQLLNLETLQWDEEICGLFGIAEASLPEICFSDSCFAESDFGGFFDEPVPVSAVLGDSHAALFAHGCLEPGMVKATYGTGSSVMMNIGSRPLLSDRGIVTSIAWGRNGRVEYAFEGNINYAAAVISWLKDDVGLIADPAETEALAASANPEDTAYLVPAFTGLGAPYWDSGAKAAIVGMTRLTGRNELVRAALCSIAYQINDILNLMKAEADIRGGVLAADGGPTGNRYLMQFQSDISMTDVIVGRCRDFSGTGAAFLAGISAGVYTMEILKTLETVRYSPEMPAETAAARLEGWRAAVAGCLSE